MFCVVPGHDVVTSYYSTPHSYLYCLWLSATSHAVQYIMCEILSQSWTKYLNKGQSYLPKQSWKIRHFAPVPGQGFSPRKNSSNPNIIDQNLNN